MKNLNIKSLISAVTFLILIGCSGDDKLVNDILENTASGAFLRTVSITNTLVYDDIQKMFVGEDPSYTLVLEAQDAEQGGLLQEVEIFANFTDNTEDTNGDFVINDQDMDISTMEMPLVTLPASRFETGPDGLPRTTVKFTAQELIDFTGVDESLIDGNDAFSFRMIMRLTDGRSFSINDRNGNVESGSFFRSPFEYDAGVSCEITENLAGTYSYVVSDLQSAPGGRSMCSPGNLVGMVTWTAIEGEEGEYKSSDISFGQLGDCYDFKPETREDKDVKIVWNCRNLDIEELTTIKLTDGNEELELSYTYTIASVNGNTLTIELSNSAGDRAIVTLEKMTDWPTIFTPITNP